VGRVLQWLEIKPTDDEKTKNKKRKLQKSFKSKVRFQEMDLLTKKKQQSWLDFKSGKGAKKKVGTSCYQSVVMGLC
jgi:survival-of-motor-neuron-related-splicing factor 30